MKGFLTKTQVGLLRAKLVVRDKVTNITSKMSGDDKLVVALVLIAVAVFLCIIFRDKIGDLIDTIFESTTEEVEGIFNGTTGGTGGTGGTGQ